jgi:hypothetical protein
VARIELRTDAVKNDVWWLFWVGCDEVVGRVDRYPVGRYTVTPEGPHWSPMKSIGRSFDSPASALREVQLYSNTVDLTVTRLVKVSPPFGNRPLPERVSSAWSAAGKRQCD